MKISLHKVMLVAIFVVAIVFARGQSVFYEEPFDTGQGWTLDSNWSITEGALKLSWSPAATNYDFSATSPDILIPMTAGDMVITQFINQYSGQGNPPETFEIVVIAGGIPNVLWSYSAEADWGTSAGRNLTLSLAPYAGQIIQLKFRATGANSYNFSYWYIYNIVAYANHNRDLAATLLSGISTPSIGNEYPYAVTVRNLGLNAVSDYTVKLMQTGNVELASVTGIPIAPGEILQINIPWTPTVAGETQIWGEILLTGDENANNNQTTSLTVTVMQAGLLVAQIGTGTDTNTAIGGPAPYGTYYQAFRQQLLYKADDLSAAGADPGMIYALAFKVQSLGTCAPMRNYTIRLKHTSQTALSTVFETGQYTTVWHRPLFLPEADWNIHTFDVPFFWNGSSNLIVEIVTDLRSGSTSQNALVSCSTSDYLSSLRFQSDTAHGSMGVTGSNSNKRSNIRFYMIPSTGAPMFVLYPDSRDFGDVVIGDSRYKRFTIVNGGGGILNINEISLAGSPAMTLSNLPTLPVALGTAQTAVFIVTYTPESQSEDTATISIIDNLDARSIHEVQLTGAGVMDISIGAGNQVAHVPLDFYYKNSLFETIYTAEELNDFAGVITGIKFYNQFSSNLTDIPTKIWLGRTSQADLSAGWIPSNQLTQVFDGTLNFPSGQNEITIEFPQFYMHLEGGNLVMMVNRPLDDHYYSASDYFKTQTVGSTRARSLYSDSIEYDPANPSAGNLNGVFPKTTFLVIPGSLGHITGTVLGADGSPLADVEVQLALPAYNTVTNSQGQFTISNLVPDNYAVTFSRPHYVSQSLDIVVEEDETAVMNVTMDLMAQVNVSGIILASDTAGGIEGANIYLVGYDNYSVSSTHDGSFSVPTVFANHSYAYSISAAGHISSSGTIEVGSSDYNMGTITLNEIAYSPNSVQAQVNIAFNAVNLQWNAPDPNAIEIIESFEGSIFPPADWSRIITNTGPTNPLGVRPTWCRFGAIPIAGSGNVAPTEGVKQAGLWWAYTHQDEWLLTPFFHCPPGAYLSFDTYATLGSPHDDHYYVKISSDGGISWTVLWDASAEAVGENHYESLVTVDLSNYGGLSVRLAFHAQDPPANEGLWHEWFIDKVYIGNFLGNTSFSKKEFADNRAISKCSHTGSAHTTQFPAQGEGLRENSNTFSISNPVQGTDRSLISYKVWRLSAGQENNESSWIFLSDEAVNSLSYEDQSWGSIPNGTYKWVVKAIYTADVISAPAFSNPQVKKEVSGNIVGFVRKANGQGIGGATVTAEGGFSTNTNSLGAYSLNVPAGIYRVSAMATDFDSLSYENIVVSPNQNTTRNFVLMPVSNEDELVPVTITALRGNYPNPFNPETTISYDLKDNANVSLAVYNVKGQLVRSLVNQDQAAGRYRVIFDARDDKGKLLSSGIYLYRFSAGKYSSACKMMLME